MAREFSPMAIKKLRGQTFEIGGIELQFTEVHHWGACMFVGGEGFATPIVFRAKNPSASWSPPFVLKGFNEPTLTRRRRTAFLCALGLAGLQLPNNFFEGAPSVPFSHEFPAQQPIAMEGYLARCILGESFDDLMLGDKRAQPWDPNIQIRISLARQLCLAIELLEGAGIVHGDLAPGNLMIVEADSTTPSLRLIDFDGFYHPRVPLLTSSEGRTWGTDGYRARAFKFKDETSVQTSDRVAMAILIMELVIRRHDDILEGDRLVLQDSIEKGEANVQVDLTKRWPQGFQRLREAIAADEPRNAPSPRDWRMALAAFAATGFSFGTTSTPATREDRCVFQVIRHNQDPLRLRLPLPRGSFGTLVPELAWLFYEEEQSGLRISGTTPIDSDRGRVEPLMLQNVEGENRKRCTGEVSAQLPWGGVLHWYDIQIKVEGRVHS